MRFHHLATITVIGLEILTLPAFAQQIPKEPPSGDQQIPQEPPSEDQKIPQEPPPSGNQQDELARICRNRGVGNPKQSADATRYRVSERETLSGIVHVHYDASGKWWPWVYCHKYNWPFRQDRPHPYRICVGDYVQLPDYRGWWKTVDKDCTDWFARTRNYQDMETPAQ